MTLGYEINHLIQKKLDNIQNKELRDFITDILLEEEENLNLGEQRYSKKYEEILSNYVKLEED